MPTLLPPDDPLRNAKLLAMREAIANGAYACDLMDDVRWQRKVARMKAAEFGWEWEASVNWECERKEFR